ncbi:MAG: hypothetical protein ABI324_24860 [Ktedonobacteraceae bacterium]
MDHILHNLVQPTAVLLLFVLLYALSVHVYGYLSDRTRPILWPILWIILAILAFLAWAFAVFA